MSGGSWHLGHFPWMMKTGLVEGGPFGAADELYFEERRLLKLWCFFSSSSSSVADESLILRFLFLGGELEGVDGLYHVLVCAR